MTGDIMPAGYCSPSCDYILDKERADDGTWRLMASSREHLATHEQRP